MFSKFKPFFLWNCRRRLRNSRIRNGFTLIETLIVVFIAGVLAAICALSWGSFWANYALSSAQNEVYQVIRDTRETAMRNNLKWQVSFRSAANQAVEWANYPAGSDATKANWQTLQSPVRLSPDTTLAKSGNLYRAVFSHKGHVQGQLGKVMLTSQLDARQRRCVVVSTLIGGMRTGNSTRQCQ